MKTATIFNYLQIDEFSATPKYLQLINAVLNAISQGKIGKDEVLPSINELSAELEMGRVTVEKSYKQLKQMGVLGSVPGKGYFIANTNVHLPIRVVLFFNKLSAHKKIIYDSFVHAIGENVPIDFYVYNNDVRLFKKLLQNTSGDYTHYVIIPHFIEADESAYDIINCIPKEKLILLDKKLVGLRGDYAAVYENFEKDIYQALEQAIEKLSKYKKLKLVFPSKSYFPYEIINGFRRFCQDYAFASRVVDNIHNEPIAEGEVYVNLMEDDLVILIERIISTQLEIGKDVGIISYNETPLKKIILNGITTISTDFQTMGEMAAKLILDNSKQHVEVPFHLTLRGSL